MKHVLGAEVHSQTESEELFKCDQNVSYSVKYSDLFW